MPIIFSNKLLLFLSFDYLLYANSVVKQMICYSWFLNIYWMSILFLNKKLLFMIFNYARHSQRSFTLSAFMVCMSVLEACPIRGGTGPHTGWQSSIRWLWWEDGVIGAAQGHVLQGAFSHSTTFTSLILGDKWNIFLQQTGGKS